MRMSLVPESALEPLIPDVESPGLTNSGRRMVRLAAAPLSTALGLHERSAVDFFDALVALGMLERHNGYYSNTPDTEAFLDRAKPSYAGGVLDYSTTHLYPFWGALTQALRTGEPQNQTIGGDRFFDSLYRDPAQLKQFMHAMTGVSMGAAMAIADVFPWHRYHTFIDVGCAEGGLAVQVARKHQHLAGGGFDLPPVASVFTDYVRSSDLQDRLTFHPGDFFTDPLPAADVLVMGHILHDWSAPEKRQLIDKAYAALPTGGALIIYESMIDDDRRTNAFGLLMSLNMLIETKAGFDFTATDCRAWLHAAGFTTTSSEPLTPSDSMVIGIK